MNGWTCIHRKLVEWEWYDSPNMIRVFLHCILMANWKPKKWRGISIQRGSFHTSYGKIASQLKLSNQQIRTTLNKLKVTGEVTTSPTRYGLLITVCEYETYNNAEKIKQQLRQQAEQQGSNSQTNNELTGSEQGSNREVTPITEQGEQGEQRQEGEEVGAKAPDDFDYLESDRLSAEGNYLEALSKRVAQSPENIQEIAKSKMISEEVLKAWLVERAAEGWMTRGKRPIGYNNWFPDLERFVRSWDRHDPGTATTKENAPDWLPDDWKAIAARVTGQPADSFASYREVPQQHRYEFERACRGLDLANA